MVGADLEGLVAAHDQAGLAVLAVLEQADVASAALLPLARVGDVLEELGAHLEDLLLALLVGLDLDLLRQVDDGLEVDVFRLGGLLLLNRETRVSKYGTFPNRREEKTNLITLLRSSGGSSLALGLGAARVVTAVLILLLLLLLGTTTEHGEHRRGGHGLDIDRGGGGSLKEHKPICQPKSTTPQTAESLARARACAP